MALLSTCVFSRVSAPCSFSVVRIQHTLGSLTVALAQAWRPVAGGQRRALLVLCVFSILLALLPRCSCSGLAACCWWTTRCGAVRWLTRAAAMRARPSFGTPTRFWQSTLVSFSLTELCRKNKSFTTGSLPLPPSPSLPLSPLALCCMQSFHLRLMSYTSYTRLSCAVFALLPVGDGLAVAVNS